MWRICLRRRTVFEPKRDLFIGPRRHRRNRGKRLSPRIDPMMFPLFRRNSRQDTISTLYGTIVAQARLPCFYREYGVTVRPLVLHLVIVLDRLAADPSCGTWDRPFSMVFARTWTIICGK